MNLNILMANSRKEDIPNINKNIKIFLSLNPAGKIFIFHDNTDLEECKPLYDSHAIIYTLNKNIGLFFGRKYLVEHISEEYNNELFFWVDSDDLFLMKGLEKLVTRSLSTNEYNMIGFDSTNRIWDLALSLDIFKRVYSYFPENPYGLRLHYEEDRIFRETFRSLMEKGILPISQYKIYTDYIDYQGLHNMDLSIPKNYKLFLEGLLVIHIWKVDNVPGIEIEDNFYRELPRLLNINRTEQLNEVLKSTLAKVDKKYFENTPLEGMLYDC